MRSGHYDEKSLSAFHVGLENAKLSCARAIRLLSLTGWISDTLSQGYTDLQSLVKCLDHRNSVSDTGCSQAKVVHVLGAIQMHCNASRRLSLQSCRYDHDVVESRVLCMHVVCSRCIDYRRLCKTFSLCLASHQRSGLVLQCSLLAGASSSLLCMIHIVCTKSPVRPAASPKSEVCL